MHCNNLWLIKKGSVDIEQCILGPQLFTGLVSHQPAHMLDLPSEERRGCCISKTASSLVFSQLERLHISNEPFRKMLSLQGAELSPRQPDRP